MFETANREIYQLAKKTQCTISIKQIGDNVQLDVPIFFKILLTTNQNIKNKPVLR